MPNSTQIIKKAKYKFFVLSIVGFIAVLFVSLAGLRFHSMILDRQESIITVQENLFAQGFLIDKMSLLSKQVIFDEDSVLIETANGESQYSWSQLGKYKEYKDMDVLSIIGKDNLPIIMLWKYSPNFENFVKVWMVKSGI